MRIKLCPICDKTHQKNGKYCSNACKQKAYRLRINPKSGSIPSLRERAQKAVRTKRRTKIMFVCEYCGRDVEYSIAESALRIYCSNACKQKAYRERKKRSNSDFDNVLMWKCGDCGQKQFVEPSSACEFCHGDNWQAVKLSGRADF